MQDNQLLQDLATLEEPEPFIIEALALNRITTYKQLLALVCDDSASPFLRRIACDALSELYGVVDGDQSIPALLAAIRSPHSDVQGAATFAIGHPGNADAVPLLTEIATDRNELESVRMSAIHALARTYDLRPLDILLRIASDLTESNDLRAHALEHSTCLDTANRNYAFQSYMRLLDDPLPDLRYWAAFAIAKLGWVMDISSACAALDLIVANDRSIPRRFGWHVNREAILALEEIYYRPFRPPHNHHQYEEGKIRTLYSKRLISPAPEYYSFMHDYRKWNGDISAYVTLPTPPVTLRIDPMWLSEQLKEQWPHIVLNNRQPRPLGYILDWQLTLDGEHLIGALHRDQYAIIITGPIQMAGVFATWYRQTIGPEYKLLTYNWDVWDESSFPIG